MSHTTFTNFSRTSFLAVLFCFFLRRQFGRKLDRPPLSAAP